MAGYLKSIKKEINILGDEEHILLFPNKEIRLSMRKIVLETASGKEVKVKY